MSVRGTFQFCLLWKDDDDDNYNDMFETNGKASERVEAQSASHVDCALIHETTGQRANPHRTVGASLLCFFTLQMCRHSGCFARHNSMQKPRKPVHRPIVETWHDLEDLNGVRFVAGEFCLFLLMWMDLGQSGQMNQE